jgi:DNA invertase Pin-like site-specific DNA recombinase
MSTTQHPRRPDSVDALTSLDQITASIVARQSRSADESLSIPDQIARAEAWCAAQTPPVLVGAIHTEKDVSGRKPLEKRKGLHAAIVDVEEGRSQMILTAYFDRFVRSTVVRAEAVQRVERAGGIVMTLDFGRTSNATAVDKLNGTLLAAIAEFYADQTGEKLTVTKQRNIDQGVPPFPRVTPAYVKREDGTLDAHPTQYALVRDACQRRARGESYDTITSFLREHDVRDTTGKLITRTGTISMLESPLLIGEIRFGSFRPNTDAARFWGCEPVCDRATWRKMRAAKSTRGRYAKSDRLLARLGVLVCESCGGRMTVSTSKSAGGASYPYYRCPNRALCSAPASVACDVAESFVLDAAVKLAAEHAADVKGRASLDERVESARVEREAAEQRFDNLIELLSGREDRESARAKLDEAQADVDAAVAEHERLSRLTASARTVTPATVQTLEGKRSVVHATIARAVVAPGRGPGRITIEGRIA